MFWFVWAYLTCSEYDIWAIAIVQINLFSFWHMNDIPCKTLTFRVFISSMLFDLTMIWRGPANVWFPRTGFRRFTNFCFWNPLMAIFKGLEPQNSALFWHLGNSINYKCSVTDFDGFDCLQKKSKSLKNSSQVKCLESGMSRSNSEKSHVDVWTLQKLEKLLYFL